MTQVTLPRMSGIHLAVMIGRVSRLHRAVFILSTIFAASEFDGENCFAIVDGVKPLHGYRGFESHPLRQNAN